jgi:small subunit ribosomal protein S17
VPDSDVDTQEAADDAAAREAAPEEAPDPKPEEEAPDPEPEEESPTDEAAGEAGAEPAEEISPKQQRKLARAHAAGPAKPERGPEERAAERAQTRQRAAANRRRHRQGRRTRRGEPRQGTPPAERSPGPKKVRLGQVVSTKADKTITVRIEVARRHPTYEKVVRRSATLHAHDAGNEAQEGDTVRVVETRPLSKSKRWRLLEIVERAR